MEETLRKIDDIFSRINVHPEYSHKLTCEFYDAVRVEADKHSSALELEAGEVSTKEREESRTRDIQRLNEARSYLTREGLTPLSFAKLGHIVSPEKQTTSGFRRKDVRFGSFEDEIPGWERLYGLAESFINNLDYLRIHPVQRAIEAHIRTVQLHPFMDGNGRVARLLQNFCLEQRRYPSAIIYDYERELYLDLMNRVLTDRYAKRSEIVTPSPEEKLFCKFISAKVLSSLEDLEAQLRERRVYGVSLERVENPSVAISIKKNLMGIGRKKQSPLVVDFEGSLKTHSPSVKVIGNVSAEELKIILEHAKNKFGIRYSLTSRCH